MSAGNNQCKSDRYKKHNMGHVTKTEPVLGTVLVIVHESKSRVEETALMGRGSGLNVQEPPALEVCLGGIPVHIIFIIM